MSVSRPLVSVVIATYNDAAWLPETLESALAQTYPHVEIIVVDDGSTDDTLRRIEPHLSRIRYVRREHEGLAGARNAGIALATGDFVALLDADDLWHPEKLTVQIAVAQRHPESGLIACDGVGFTSEDPNTGPLLRGPLRRMLLAAAGREITGRFHDQLLDGNPITCPAQVLVPRHVLREIGPFVDSMVQDYDYYLRVAQRWPVALHRDGLVRYRERPDSMSGPLERRRMACGWDLLRALRSHALRCDAAGHQRAARHLRANARAMAYCAYVDGLSGSRPQATRVLLRLLREAMSPLVVPYLVGLWTPETLRTGALSGFRALKRRLSSP
jgi:glycosyltransferase involved in cell wall biosynthesis